MKAQLFITTILLLTLAALLAACTTAPQNVINAWQVAMNKGDIDLALSYLAQDATVTIIPAFDGDGIYSGQSEIRGWYEMLAGGKGVTTLSDCKKNGNTITCLDTYADEGLKSIGVDFLESDFVAALRDGKIQSYTVTTRPESLAKLPPPEPQPASAETPSPEDIADSWTKALASGDIDAALSYLAENAAVAIIPPGPDGDGVYNGHVEIRGWYDTIVAAKGVGALSDCKTEGADITCLNTYADEGLKSMGVDFIEGDWTAVISDGKIQSYTFTITPESLAKFPAPPEPTAAPEIRINLPEKMVGKWDGKNGEYVVLHDFLADGTLLVNVSGVGLISRSRYWFEDDLLKIEDTTGDCIGTIGSYEVYATYVGEKLVLLRFGLVGNDTCSDRKNTLAGKIMTPH
jgi:ketosteroid isomerase-like protein